MITVVLCIFFLQLSLQMVILCSICMFLFLVLLNVQLVSSFLFHLHCYVIIFQFLIFFHMQFLCWAGNFHCSNVSFSFSLAFFDLFLPLENLCWFVLQTPFIYYISRKNKYNFIFSISDTELAITKCELISNRLISKENWLAITKCDLRWIFLAANNRPLLIVPSNLNYKACSG